jgi:hypothetical protein
MILGPKRIRQVEQKTKKIQNSEFQEIEIKVESFHEESKLKTEEHWNVTVCIKEITERKRSGTERKYPKYLTKKEPQEKKQTFQLLCHQITKIQKKQGRYFFNIRNPK